jgi:hypothetical protein
MFKASCSRQSSFYGCMLLVCTLTQTATAKLPAAAPPQVSYENVPISFEVNQGQTDKRVVFLGHGFFFTPESVVVNLPIKESSNAPLRSGERSYLAVRMSFAGTAHPAVVMGDGELGSRSHYLIGHPSNWHTDVPHCARVRYRQVYPGVDMVFYGSGHDLEYDVVLAPGADVKQVRLRFEGAEMLEVDPNGDLILHTKGGDIRQLRPRVYQAVRGRQLSVKGKYVLRAANEAGFELGAFDHSKPVVIDPVLRWSTYLGGSSDDHIAGIALDGTEHAFVAGTTQSPNFPTTPGVIQRTFAGNAVAFVSKFTRNGSGLLYSTYFGGTNCVAVARAIRVDNSGNAYITGDTGCGNFPVTSTAYQKTLTGSTDAFAVKLNYLGTRFIYATYLGGNDEEEGWSIALDSAGSAYVTGLTGSPDFPVTPGAIQMAPSFSGFTDAFVTKLSPEGGSIVYSTYLGGPPPSTEHAPRRVQRGTSIKVDSSGSAYVMGKTNSSQFPVTAGAFQTTFGGFGQGYNGDVFVTKFNPAGTAFVYSTYLGGEDDENLDGDLAIDSAGNAYITGQSLSGDFPTTPGAFRSPASCGPFLTKLNSAGTGLVYSAHWDGGGHCINAFGSGVAVDSQGHAYVIGSTAQEWPEFPFRRAFQTWIGGPYESPLNGFVMKMNPLGTAIDYSSLLGGTGLIDLGYRIVLDASNSAYVTGQTESTDFPVTQFAFQKSNGGNFDSFVAKIVPICDAGPTDPSVTICGLADGVTVHSPVTVTANTRDSASPVTRTEVWVDNVKVYQVKLAAIYAKISMTVGTHRLTVKSLDHSGLLFKKTVYINVAP